MSRCKIAWESRLEPAVVIPPIDGFCLDADRDHDLLTTFVLALQNFAVGSACALHFRAHWVGAAKRKCRRCRRCFRLSRNLSALLLRHVSVHHSIVKGNPDTSSSSFYQIHALLVLQSNRRRNLCSAGRGQGCRSEHHDNRPAIRCGASPKQIDEKIATLCWGLYAVYKKKHETKVAAPKESYEAKDLLVAGPENYDAKSGFDSSPSLVLPNQMAHR
ncbi:hypothetical protein IWX47DRAFT_927632 [Phyllosticta citricarpa]